METENAVQDDLLLHVDNVACRKFGEGILTVMKDRLIWRSTIGGTTIVHKYEDIKAQKVSPANKLKVQLQICLQNGANTTFQFLNPLGSEGQLRDRESVKELLQQLLPRFRRKLHPELELKQKVLQSNKTLLSLYKELVVSKVLSTEDFWNYFGAEELSSQTKTKVQKTGVSAGFVNGMTQTDACNEVKFNITNDIMLSIFRIYPTVKQKHMELVPSQMTEEQFWTQFFNSHYFHRDRLTNLNPKEVFVDCLRIESEDMENQLRHILMSTEEKQLVPVDEMQDMCESLDLGSEDDKNGRKNPSLIGRLNYHSCRIICTNCDYVGLPDDEAALLKQSVEGAARGANKLSANGNVVVVEGADAPPPLHLPPPGTKPLFQPSSSCQYSEQERRRLFDVVKQSEEFWSSEESTDVLLEENAQLSFSASDGFFVEDEPNLNDIIKPDVMQEISALQFFTCQLLCRFWSCYPPTSPEAEQQLIAMAAALKRFDESKIQSLNDQISMSGVLCEMDCLGTLKTSLNIAYAKYEQWLEKKNKTNGL